MATKTRILIVEDDLPAGQLLGSILERNGYEVTIETDGQKGWEALHGSPRPHLLVLDLGLPLISGLEILEMRGSDSDISDIPVIVISGGSPRPILPDRVPFLAKPLKIPALLSLVESFRT